MAKKLSVTFSAAPVDDDEIEDSDCPAFRAITVAQNEEQIPTPSFWSFYSVRFHVALLLCGAVLTQGLMRTNLSMAMVCMVSNTALDLESRLPNQSAKVIMKNQSKTGCQLPPEAKLEYEGSFIWTSDQQAMLFAAMSWGGLISGFPAGWLADRYGPKILCLVSVLLNIIGSFLSPIVAVNTGFAGFFILRIIMGIGQGVVLPCMATMLVKWFPVEEKSSVIAIYTAGNQLSVIISLPVAAWLCKQKHFLGGWPSTFYSAGVVAILWCILWGLHVTNSPAKHPRMSLKERAYILHKVQAFEGRKAATKNVPWVKMLKSTPLMACVVCNFAAALYGMTLSTYVPTYFKQVLYFSLRDNGLYSALPFIVQWCSKFVFAPFADGLKKRTNISHTWICKVFNSIGCFGPAVFLSLLAFMGCKETKLAIVFLCLAVGSFAGFIPGFLTSSVSIAPQYAGTINSFCRLSGQLGAITSPYLVGWTTIHGSQEEWMIVFLSIAFVMFLSGVFFLIFGSAEPQPWAERKDSSLALCKISSATLSSQNSFSQDKPVITSD